MLLFKAPKPKQLTCKSPGNSATNGPQPDQNRPLEVACLTSEGFSLRVDPAMLGREVRRSSGDENRLGMSQFPDFGWMLDIYII